MKNKFKKQKYLIIKKAITKDVTDFIFEYFSLRKDVFYYMWEKTNQIPNIRLGGHGDDQVSNTYANYADPVMETLLKSLRIKELSSQMTQASKIALFKFFEGLLLLCEKLQQC